MLLESVSEGVRQEPQKMEAKRLSGEKWINKTYRAIWGRTREYTFITDCTVPGTVFRRV